MFRRLITIAAGGMLGMVMLAAVTLRVGALFGAGASLDAYLVAVSGPSLLLSLAATVMAPALTPRLSVLDHRAAARRAGEWAALVFLGGVSLAFIAALCRTWIIAVLAPGLSPASAKIAAHVLAIYGLSLPATLAASAYGAYGFSNGRVWTNGASSALYGLTWLVLLFTHPLTGSVTGVTVACVLASQVQLVSAFLCSAGRGTKPWPRLRAPAHPWLALAAVSGIAVNAAMSKANIVLDPILGSLAGRGDISLLVYATRLVILIVAVCGQAPALVILAGRRSTGGRANPLAPTAIGVTILIACGIATAVAIVFEPVAGVLLAHGQFKPSAAMHIGRIVEAYAPSILLMTVAWSLEFVLYSLGLTWRIVLLNLPALIVNVALSVALLPGLGVMARPIAVGASLMTYVVLLSVYLRRLPAGFDVIAAIPKRAAAALTGAVAVICLASRIIGTRVFHAPVAGSVLALIATGILVVWVARRWLGHRDPFTSAGPSEMMGSSVPASIGRAEGMKPRDRYRVRRRVKLRPEDALAPVGVAFACVMLGAGLAVLGHPIYLLGAVCVVSVVLVAAVYGRASGVMALLFAGAALVPVVSTSSNDGSPTLSALRTALILGLTVLAGMQLWGTHGVPERLRPVVGGLGAMALLGAVVTLFTSHGAGDYIKEAAQAAGQPLAYAMVLAAAVCLLRVSDKAREHLVAAWCIAVVAESVIVAGQLATGAAYDPLRGFTRAQGTMGADFLGVFSAMGVFAGAYLRAAAHSARFRRLGNAAIIAGIFALIASISRGSLIGLGIGLLTLLLVPSRGGPNRRRTAQALVIVAIVGVGLYAGRGLWEARLSSAGGFDRPATWVSGLRIAEDNLLTGVGPRHVAQVVTSNLRYSDTPYGMTTSNPHNAWLFVADSEGVPYAVLLILVSFALIRALMTESPSPSRRYLLASLAAGGSVFFINNLFDHPEIMLYFLLATALAVTEVPSVATSRERRRPSRRPQVSPGAPRSRPVADSVAMTACRRQATSG